MIRTLIDEGASDGEVLSWFESRYGQFVLMEPKHDGANRILWSAGPIMALLALFIAWRTIQGRNGPRASDNLSDEEQARLDALMKE